MLVSVMNRDTSESDGRSAHCRSSRKSVRGCAAVAKTRTKDSNTRLKRFCASAGESGATGSCGPTMSSTSGITSVMTRPLGATASRMRVRYSASTSAGSVSNCRVISRKAWISDA